MKYVIPGQKNFEIKTIILDLNGTLSVAGVISSGIKPRIDTLKDIGFRLILFTGNTRGDAEQLAQDLGIDWELAKSAEDKRDLALTLEPKTCASIGNGLIDLELMKVVKLRIVTLQAEGAHIQTLLNSDLVVPSISNALDLFVDEKRLVASLRR